MHKSTVFGLGFGILAGAVAVCVAIGAAAGGHGVYWPAHALLPWSMLVVAWVEVADRAFDLVTAIALVQYPIYGALIGARRAWAWPLAVIHVAAAVLSMLLAVLWRGGNYFP